MHALPFLSHFPFFPVSQFRSACGGGLLLANNPVGIVRWSSSVWTPISWTRPGRWLGAGGAQGYSDCVGGTKLVCQRFGGAVRIGTEAGMGGDQGPSNGPR